MWRLGSTHCRKLGEGGSQIHIIDSAAVEISCECFAAARQNIDKIDVETFISREVVEAAIGPAGTSCRASRACATPALLIRSAAHLTA
jgi:hypothetical protein